MEEYKKKYEEAILRMYKWFEGSEIVDPKEVAEFVFPELKESEDEKIRKKLISYFSNVKGFSSLEYNYGITQEEAVAWLKKQCEQPDANKEYWRGYREGKQEVLDKYTELEKQGEQPNKVSIWKHWKDGIAGNGEGKTIFLVKNGNTYSISSCLVCECDYIELSELDKLMVEKQGEQKPVADFSDLRTWKYIVDAVWTEKEGIGQYLDSPLTEEVAKKLQKRFGNIEQKPAFCHHEVDFSGCSEEYRKAYYDGWNNCNQQHDQLEAEQKPAWSEEDENGLGDALWAVQQARSIAKDENEMGGLWYAEKWLKSLKERMKGE